MKILTIVGPTATGKTELAMKIAKYASGEIISADSRQIFKYLNIGTAKPSIAQRRAIRFHLIDFVEPDEGYSCGQFARDAAARIKDIKQRKITPIICGGTGLYIRALFHPLHDLPRSDKDTKHRLGEMLDKRGIDYMYAKLQRIDAAWAKRITHKDKQRILRGLEVYEITGKPLTEWLRSQRSTAVFHPYYIGLNLPRPQLYARIDHRFDTMIEQGFVAEVKDLLARGFRPESSALRTIGYKEIIKYLQGEVTLAEAIAKAKQRTRNYAKRQMTWFSKIPEIKWFAPEETIPIASLIRQTQ
jgi:tRNA dimethylallyltransferase